MRLARKCISYCVNGLTILLKEQKKKANLRGFYELKMLIAWYREIAVIFLGRQQSGEYLIFIMSACVSGDWLPFKNDSLICLAKRNKNQIVEKRFNNFSYFMTFYGVLNGVFSCEILTF